MDEVLCFDTRGFDTAVYAVLDQMPAGWCVDLRSCTLFRCRVQ